MSLWVIRAGRHGEQEQDCLDRRVTAIGWDELPDLSSIDSKEELKSLYTKTYPNETKYQAAVGIGQVWAFIKRVKLGDLVVLPLKTRSAIAIGKVTGPYQYRNDLSENTHHTHSVEWIRTDMPRTDFDQDLLYSFGSMLTISQPQRSNAEKRVQAILDGKQIMPPSGPDNHESEPEQLDIEQVAVDQIRDYINRNFKGHDLARLVDGVLRAQGYTTKFSPPGPDGGVDILVGSGPMGFDSPRICVQVKSTQSPADVNNHLGRSYKFPFSFVPVSSRCYSTVATDNSDLLRYIQKPL